MLTSTGKAGPVAFRLSLRRGEAAHDCVHRHAGLHDVRLAGNTLLAGPSSVIVWVSGWRISHSAMGTDSPASKAISSSAVLGHWRHV